MIEFAHLLRKTVLFANMDDDELESALDFYNADTANYKKGQYIIKDSDRMVKFGLMLSGTVQVFMDDINGDRIIMASVSCAETFGESLCFSEKPKCGVYIEAVSDCEIMWLSCDNLKLGNVKDNDNYLRFIRLLTVRTLSMNDRIQVLSKRTLRRKLLTFFTQCHNRTRSDDFEISMDREGLAAYLGADRSALSRELGQMEREGIISFSKNRFVLRKH